MWHVDDLDLRGSWRPRAWLLDPIGEQERELVVTGGEVTLDDSDLHEVSCTLRVAELTGVPPTRLGQELMPDGREVRVSVIGSRTGVEVPVLVGPIVRTAWSRSATRAGEVELEVRPRSWRFSWARWEAPQVVPSGVPLDVLVPLLLASRAPNVPRIIEQDGRTLPRTLWWGEDSDNDPWADLRRLARARQMRLRVDRQGTVRWEHPREAPTVAFGPDPLTVAAAEAELSNEMVYSGVVAFSTHVKGPAIRVVVWDTDPASPTRIDGPFGRKPMFWGSPLFTDAAEAEAAARTRLERARRQLIHARLRCRLHPGLDVTDQARIVLPGDPLLTEALVFGVERVSWSLGAAEMEVELSARVEAAGA